MPLNRRPARKVEVITLGDRDQAVLSRRHPELTGYSALLVVAASQDVQHLLSDVVRELADAVNEGERVNVERLIDALVPRIEVPPPQTIERARREALLRTRLLRDFGAYTSQQLAQLGGSAAGNRSQLAYRWRRDGRVFAVMHQGTAWYLSFQFDDTGQPLPVVAPVLERLEEWSAWDVAAWFVRENGMLDRRRPVDVLQEEPDAVIAAATFDGGRPEEARPSA